MSSNAASSCVSCVPSLRMVNLSAAVSHPQNRSDNSYLLLLWGSGYMRHQKQFSQFATSIRTWKKGTLGVKTIKDHELERGDVSRQGLLSLAAHGNTWGHPGPPKSFEWDSLGMRQDISVCKSSIRDSKEVRVENHSTSGGLWWAIWTLIKHREWTSCVLSERSAHGCFIASLLLFQEAGYCCGTG